RNQLTLEDKIRVLSIELENTSNLLKHSERINADVETAKKELQTKLDNHLVQTKKWRNSSKTLYRLIDSSMSVRRKVSLGFNNYIREHELGWDDPAFSVFTTNSEDVEGRPLFNRFAKDDSMKVVPPPLFGDYTSLSDHIDLDESQMFYGTKSLTSSDSKSVSNDFISCDDSDKSSEININNFASSDSSVKSSEPKPNDSTSCASTSSVSTSENEAEIEFNENPFQDAEDEGVFDSGCSRSMTDTECLVLSKDFKLPDASMVVLRVLRKHNIYIINLNNLCPRGKQHKASYKAIHAVSSISEPLQLLPMDLFGPTSIRSIDHKYDCLVITDDYSRICWVFFLEHKDKTYHILKDFINLVENQLNKKREYSNAKIPQQNRVAERKNRTLIEAARTMLVDSKLPTMFWTEAVRTACYVLNRVLVTSPHNKTPYALLTGNIPYVSHFKPFGCHVTIPNTSDHLGKFAGKADEGYIVGYSASNKAYRVYNVPNKRVEETMNLRFLEEKPNVHGTQDADSDSNCDEQVIIVPSYPSHNIQGTEPKDTSGDEVDDSPLTSADGIFQKELARLKGQEQRATYDAESLGLGFANDAEELQKRASAKTVPSGSIPVLTGSIPVPSGDTTVSTNDVPVHTSSPTDLFFNDEPTTRIPSPSDLGNHDPSPGIFSSSSYDDDVGAGLNNVASTVEVGPVATTRLNTIHPQSLIIGDHTSAMQTRSKAKKSTTGESAFISYIYDQQRDNHTDFQHCLFACFLSQVEPRSVAQALEDPSKYAIGTKWILKNKRDARGIVVRNKARFVAQGHRQEEGIDYDEVFAPVTRIKAIRLFLAFASYMGLMVYQMDVKSVFLYERIDEEVYVTQPKGFVDPHHPKKVYKAWCDEFEALMKEEFQMSAMGELTFFLGLQVQQRPDGIFINQDKYVQEILNKFDLGSFWTATTPYEAPKPKSKNESDSLVNIHLYRSMIGSLIESPLMLEAYSDSDYAGANKDKKSTTGGCQFLGRRLISWQCKKQTIVATSSTEAEYVAAANYCGQAFDGPRFNHLVVNIGMINP
nr:hypothetical protein [Tanacetum cinerariifolium]